MTTGEAIALTIWTFVPKSDISAFLHAVLVCHRFSSKDQGDLPNFMAVVTICSDFGAQENKVCHCFHCFPIYLLHSDGTGYRDLCSLDVEF